MTLTANMLARAMNYRVVFNGVGRVEHFGRYLSEYNFHFLFVLKEKFNLTG
jgi:hypothetical protein